ncbi:hypothetical protein D3C73_1415130 [compost metagenome]
MILDDQISPFHKVNAHLLSQEGMLIISRIIFTRCKQGDYRVRSVRRRKTAKHGKKTVDAMIHIPDGILEGQLGEQLIHQGSSFK